VVGAMHESPGLGKVLWAGRPSVTMDSPSTVDPWYLLAPRRILAGYVQITDFSLPLGTVVKDYVAEGLFASSARDQAPAAKPRQKVVAAASRGSRRRR
jgi:hypothetical protein